jgi:hypothetical protein
MQQPKNLQIDSSESSRSADDRFERVLTFLHTFYGAVGNAPNVEGSLAAMARVLMSKASDQDIIAALELCMSETYPVRLPHILGKLPGTEQADKNAAKRIAWDTVERYVNNWGRWNDDRTVCTIEANAPRLDQRLLDTVRRSGGWSVLMRMTDADFPHQQKRFFEEWEAWVEVERIQDRKLLEMPNAKNFLEGKGMA